MLSLASASAVEGGNVAGKAEKFLLLMSTVFKEGTLLHSCSMMCRWALGEGAIGTVCRDCVWNIRCFDMEVSCSLC